ncbi:elongation factor P [Elusimicrobiota bacterium]
MTTVTAQIKEGNTVKVDGNFYKVISVNVHTGGGKTGSMVHIKLRHLETGHVIEKRYAPDEKVEEVAVERAQMQFLYEEGDSLCFMNPETFEQIAMKSRALGPARAFLRESDIITIELHDGAPISADFPKVVDAAIASTGAGIKGDATYKEAVPENGLTILVPQFIKAGDKVHIEVETREYLDRVKETKESKK